MIMTDQPSFQSLFLETQVGKIGLSTASGFIVRKVDGTRLLITNWHVVSGRHLETRQPLSSSHAVPDFLRIAHNAHDALGSWVLKTERLYDDAGDPRWLEHPIHGACVDVVGLPLTDLEGVDDYPYSCSVSTGHDVLPGKLSWGASDFVNVIGFPFGWTGGGSLGIWVQGAIATEPELDYSGLPRFLIDSRTRQGQSGSPVIIYKRSGWVNLVGRGPYMIHNPITLLLGVYSGRLSTESDLGTVWKSSVVAEIAENGKRGRLP